MTMFFNYIVIDRTNQQNELELKVIISHRDIKFGNIKCFKCKYVLKYSDLIGQNFWS